MSLLVTLNGANYIIPQTNEVGWGSNLDDYFVAIPAGVLQKTGGSFTLSAETDFGASFGLKSLSYKSRSSNIAATGILRLANNSDAVSWRNAGNSADLALTVNASNQLCFNGTPIESNALTSAHILVGSAGGVATDVAMSGNIGIDNTGATTIQAGVIVNSMVNASAAIAYSKLNLTGGIVNADVNASAAIAYSKLNLALSIVNADVSTSAAIAYSKLNLTGSIVNADVNASAAIAYSKLALTGSIVNADISSSAAIAITKIAIGTANQIIGTNNGATANEFKTLTATANQVSVTHGAGTVTFATPQDIATSSAVRFGSLTLGGALDASSILSLTSTSKGFLPPVMTTTQKNAISSPTDGLIVYDSSLAQLFLRAASAWTPLSVGGGSGTVASGTQYQMSYYAANGTTISGTSTITTDASGNLIVTTNTTVGPSGTGTTNALLKVDGGNGTNTGAQIRLLRNAVLKATIGTYSSVFGSGGADDLVIYSPSNQIILNTGGTDALTISTAGVATIANTGNLGLIINRTDTKGGLIGLQNAGTTKSWIGCEGALTGNTSFNTCLYAGSGLGINFYINDSATAVGAFTTAGNFDTTVPIRSRVATVGGAAFLQAFNSDNTNLASSAQLQLIVGGGSAGDPSAFFQVNGTTGMSIGVDNSDSDALVISQSSTLGTTNAVRIDSSTSAVAIRGSNTNDSAAAGFVGEVISSATNTAPPSTGTWGDLTSITLTAGNWLISAQLTISNGAPNSYTRIQLGVSTTSGNSSTGLAQGNNWMIQDLEANQLASTTIAAYQVNLSGSTVHYLKMNATYASTVQNLYGRITAVRIR